MKSNFMPRDQETLDNAEYFTTFQKRGSRREHCYKREFKTLEEAQKDAEITYNEYKSRGVLIYAVGLNRDALVGAYDHNGGRLFF